MFGCLACLFKKKMVPRNIAEAHTHKKILSHRLLGFLIKICFTKIKFFETLWLWM
jgi:hypothetical protein